MYVSLPRLHGKPLWRTSSEDSIRQAGRRGCGSGCAIPAQRLSGPFKTAPIVAPRHAWAALTAAARWTALDGAACSGLVRELRRPAMRDGRRTGIAAGKAQMKSLCRNRTADVGRGRDLGGADPLMPRAHPPAHPRNSPSTRPHSQHEGIGIKGRTKERRTEEMKLGPDGRCLLHVESRERSMLQGSWWTDERWG